MKKGTFFKTLAVFGACLGAPLLLTGCQSGDNDLLEFRVQDGYIQYTKDGKTWENIILSSELKGEPGKGIKRIMIDNSQSDETKTTYIIVFDDNTTYSYVVKNGTNGTDGEDGEDGTDGSIVTIGEDGYWYIDGVKTDVKAKGEDGTNGSNGKDGTNGNGIKSITIDQANSDSTKTTYIIVFDDNTTFSYVVKNGTNGTNGTDGEDGEDGKDGSIVTIGEDGYWYIDGVKTDVKAKGEDGTDGTNGTDGEDGKDGKDAEIDTYTITYDYGIADIFFNEVKETETIKATQWLTTLPEIDSEHEDSFLGWFIAGTEKQIENYDFVGGNVTLEARFDIKTAPSGLYQNGKYVTTWENLIKSDSGYTISPVLKRYDGHIVFDESITEISMNAFAHQTELTGITLNSNVSIGVDAFAYCSNLKNVYFGENEITVSGEAFKDCISLKEIVIPGSITTISKDMFNGCTSLSRVIIENGVESIESRAFAGCSSLSEVIIADTVTSIGQYAFSACKEDVVLVILDRGNAWTVNNATLTISGDGRLASVDGGEEVALGTLITSTYNNYVWTKQTTE